MKAMGLITQIYCVCIRKFHLQDFRLSKVVFWSVLFSGILIFRLLNSSGMSQGDDFIYTELAHYLEIGTPKNYYHHSFLRWPVYFPVALLYKLFGVNDVTGLIWPVTLSMANLVLAYSIVKKETGRRCAFLSTGLYAFLPLVSVYSTFLQTETVLEFTTLAMIFFMQKGIQDKRNATFGLSGVFAALSVMCRVTAVLFFPIILLYLFYKIRSRSAFLKPFLTFSLISAGILIFQVLYYDITTDKPLYVASIMKDTVQLMNTVEGIDGKEFFFYFKAFFEYGYFYNRDYFSWYGFIFHVACLYCLGNKIKKALIFAAWFFGYWFLMTVAPNSLSPYHPQIRAVRYMIVFALPLVTVVGLALEHLIGHKKKYVRILGIIFFMALILQTGRIDCKISNGFKIGSRPARELTHYVLSLPGVLYSVDLNFPRHYRYYSGYKMDAKEVRSFNQITKPGQLILCPFFPDARYIMDRKYVWAAYNNPPKSWTLLKEDSGFKVFHVEPYDPQDFSAILNHEIKFISPTIVDFASTMIAQSFKTSVVDQDMRGFGHHWRNSSHLFTAGEGPGSTIGFAFVSEQAQTAQFRIIFTKSYDYGILKIYWNGKLLNQPVDLYCETPSFTHVDYRDIAVDQGTNSLVFEISGKNAKSTGYRFGLDCLQVGVIDTLRE